MYPYSSYDHMGQAAFQTMPRGDVVAPVVDVQAAPRPFDPIAPPPTPSPLSSLIARLRPGTVMFAAIGDPNVRAMAPIPADQHIATIFAGEAKFGRPFPPRNLSLLQRVSFEFLYGKPEWYVFSQHVGRNGSVSRGWIRHSAITDIIPRSDSPSTGQAPFRTMPRGDVVAPRPTPPVDVAPRPAPGRVLTRPGPFPPRTWPGRYATARVASSDRLGVLVHTQPNENAPLVPGAGFVSTGASNGSLVAVLTTGIPEGPNGVMGPRREWWSVITQAGYPGYARATDDQGRPNFVLTGDRMPAQFGHAGPR